MTSDLFLKFFHQCPVIIIPDYKKNIQEFYLEEILKIINYNPEQAMVDKNNQSKILILEQWCIEKRRSSKSSATDYILTFDSTKINEIDKESLMKLADSLIYTSWIDENIKCLYDLLDLIQFHNLNGYYFY